MINESKCEIVYIPEKPPIPPDQQPTVNVYAAIIDPKDANILVRKLNQIAPLENLRHVKRIRKQRLEEKNQLSVILCLACENDQDSIPNNVLDIIKLFQFSIFITKVCKFAALSKEEWEEQCKLWPTSYHPPTYNINGITGFSEEDSHSVLYFMKLAVHMAKFCTNQVVNAAIIVNPSTKEVIAKACDQVFSQTPSSSKATVETRYCTERKLLTSQLNVSRVDNYAISESASCDEASQLQSGVSCLYPWEWAKEKSQSCFPHPLRHAGMVAIDHAAARDRRLFLGVGACGDNPTAENYKSSSIGSPVKRQKIRTNVEDEEKPVNKADNLHSASERPYLCTGYDIFLVWEPCTMCAMALVHQRIHRIFYAFSNPNDGALGSVHRLQGEKSLNHHYAVFQVLLPEKILQDLNPDDELNTISYLHEATSL